RALRELRAALGHAARAAGGAPADGTRTARGRARHLRPRLSAGASSPLEADARLHLRRLRRGRRAPDAGHPRTAARARSAQCTDTGGLQRALVAVFQPHPTIQRVWAARPLGSVWVHDGRIAPGLPGGGTALRRGAAPAAGARLPGSCGLAPPAAPSLIEV